MSNKISPIAAANPQQGSPMVGQAPSFITQVQQDSTQSSTGKGSNASNKLPQQNQNQGIAKHSQQLDGYESTLSWSALMCGCCQSERKSQSGGMKPSEKPNSPLTEQSDVLLPPKSEVDSKKKTLVLDLDETLIHSAFQHGHSTSFEISVEIEGRIHIVYVSKRPYVDQFLSRMAEVFELVIFTASLGKYADPVIDTLDPNSIVKHRLFRESCTTHFGSYVKDMSRLGRDLRDIIILDNSPFSYLFQPENGVAVSTWFDDQSDRELLDLIPYLESLSLLPDVRTEIQQRHVLNESGDMAGMASS